MPVLNQPKLQLLPTWQQAQTSSKVWTEWSKYQLLLLVVFFDRHEEPLSSSVHVYHVPKLVFVHCTLPTLKTFIHVNVVPCQYPFYTQMVSYIRTTNLDINKTIRTDSINITMHNNQNVKNIGLKLKSRSSSNSSV